MSLRILHVIPNLQFSGKARHLMLLGASLPQDQFEMRVGVLGREASWVPALEKTGVPVHGLGPNRCFDLVTLWNLRRLIQSFRPNVLHAWGSTALRTLVLAKGRSPASILLSSPFPSSARGKKTSVLERWLLKGATQVVVRGAAEELRYRDLGLPRDKVTCIPPGVAEETPPLARRAGRLEQVPTSAPLIACAGALLPPHGFREAIWTLDILQFVHEDIRLWLIGEGPDQEYLAGFAQRAMLKNRVDFLGPRANVQALLAQAAMVWVPTLQDGGTQVALEAMMAGRPVLAFDCPSLREIIVEGQTGFLLPRGDKVALARRSNQLLLQPGLARQLGQAGRDRARTHFSAERLAQNFARLYRNLAA